MAENALAQVERWLQHAIAALEPTARRALFRDILTELRRRQQKRIAAETAPDGQKWAPRKRDREGRVRKLVKLLQGMRRARALVVQARADGGTLGYSGRAGRIAATHHLGQVDAVAPGGPRVKYAARALLGLTDDDKAMIRERVLAAVAP